MFHGMSRVEQLVTVASLVAVAVLFVLLFNLTGF